MYQNRAWAVLLHINCICAIDVADTFWRVRLMLFFLPSLVFPLARMNHDGYEKSHWQVWRGSDIFDENFTATRGEHVWHNVRTDKYRASAVDCRIYEILAATILLTIGIRSEIAVNRSAINQFARFANAAIIEKYIPCENILFLVHNCNCQDFSYE